jgi:RhoGEF domain
MYTTYVNAYDRSCDTIDSLHDNETFQQFLRKQRKDKACQGNKLVSFLIMPVQRIPLYELMLRKLLRLCERNADYERAAAGSEQKVTVAKLKLAVQKVSEIGTFLNESKRDTEQWNGLLALADELSSAADFQIAAPHRRLLMDGKLTKVSSFGFRKVRRVLLFNDVLVWAESSGRIRQHISLEHTQVSGVSSDLLAIQLLHPKMSDALILYADDTATAQKWRTAIDQAITKAIAKGLDSRRKEMFESNNKDVNRLTAMSSDHEARAAVSSPSFALELKNRQSPRSTASSEATPLDAPTTPSSAFLDVDAAQDQQQKLVQSQTTARRAVPKSKRVPVRALALDRVSPNEQFKPVRKATPSKRRHGDSKQTRASPDPNTLPPVAQLASTVRSIKRRLGFDDVLSLLNGDEHGLDVPAVVQKVLEAVALVLGVNGSGSPSPEHFDASSQWSAARRLVTRPHLLAMIIGHGSKRLPVDDDDLEILQREYIRNPLLEAVVVFKVSPTACLLWNWVLATYAYNTGVHVQLYVFSAPSSARTSARSSPRSVSSSRASSNRASPRSVGSTSTARSSHSRNSRVRRVGDSQRAVMERMRRQLRPRTGKSGGGTLGRQRRKSRSGHNTPVGTLSNRRSRRHSSIIPTQPKTPRARRTQPSQKKRAPLTPRSVSSRSLRSKGNNSSRRRTPRRSPRSPRSPRNGNGNGNGKAGAARFKF